MFERPDSNYYVLDQVIDAIAGDGAGPIANIVSVVDAGSSVLDIGSGSGVLARAFSRLGKVVTIDAIEPNKTAADLSRAHYRDVFQGYAQDYLDVIQSRRYDYIVLADVLEHIVNPLQFLHDLIPRIDESCNIMISLPNIAFGGIRLSLLKGHFHYVDSGLLERTHVRFFTLESALEMFRLAGLYPLEVFYLQRSFLKTEFSTASREAPLLASCWLASQADARAYQYLFILNRDARNGFVVERKGINGLEAVLELLGLQRIIDKIMPRCSKVLNCLKRR